MANKKINDLDAVDAVTDAMQFEIDVGGVTAGKATASQLKEYIGGGGAVDTVEGNIVDNTDPDNPVVNQIQTNWTQADTGEPDYIQNKPTNLNQFTNGPAFVNAAGAASAAPVQSVAGRVGAVVLTSSDVGLGNVVNVAQLPLSYLDTDTALAANSDAKVASQKATKAYADTKFALSNLDTDGTLAANSDTKVASQKAGKTYADTKVPQTRTINSQALSANVTLTTANIADATNARYVTDANLTAINALASMSTQAASAVAITGGTITGLGTPSGASDAANKDYVDTTIANVITGLDQKDSSHLATTAALTATYANGTLGVGATLTNAGAQAAFALDTVTGVVGRRYLVKNQAAPAQNGIYTLTTAGSGATNWVLTRATDFDQAAEVSSGAYTVVEAGTTNGGTLWFQTGVGPFTIGTTAIAFTELIVAPQTLTFTGNVTGSGSSSIALTIGAGVVTNAMHSNMATMTIKGNNTGGSAAPLDLTASQTKVVLSLDNVTNVAQMPLSYLDIDGTLAANSDAKVASQKATKTYADAAANAAAAAAITSAVTTANAYTDVAATMKVVFGFPLSAVTYPLGYITGTTTNQATEVNWPTNPICDVAIGPSAFKNRNAGSNGVAVGPFALYSLKGIDGFYYDGVTGLGYGNGMHNVAIGAYALYSADATGQTAGYGRAGYNVAIGYRAFSSLTYAGGEGNSVAIGCDAANRVTTGMANTVVGGDAQGPTTGGANTLIGNSAGGFGMLGADGNTIIGCATAPVLTTGDYNVIIGAGNSGVGGVLTTGSYNIVIGVDNTAVLGSSSTSDTLLIKGRGTAVISATSTNSTPVITLGGGTSAPSFNATTTTTGFQLGGVTALRWFTNDSGTAGVSMAVGVSALSNQSGSAAAYQSTAVGYQAMGNAATMTTAATNNSAFGYKALSKLTTGAQNTAVGCNAMIVAAGSNYNVAVGYNAMVLTTTLDQSVAVGAFALSSMVSNGTGQCTAIGCDALSATTAGPNTAVGAEAGKYISTGVNNCAVGDNSLLGLTGTKITGSQNSAFGSLALGTAQGAVANNTALGYKAGFTITTGTKNTIVGSLVGSATLTTGANNILIGIDATCTTAASGTSNTLLIKGTGTAIVSATATDGTPIITFGGPIMFQSQVVAHTEGVGAPYGAAATESGSVYTNEGATAKVYIQLPTAVKGLRYSGIVQDTDGLRLVANTGDTIRINTAVSASAGFCEATAIGASVDLIAINATEWIALSSLGTWTVT